MTIKNEITHAVTHLNDLGCDVKVLYQYNTVYLEVSGNSYFSGTKPQVLSVLHAISKAVVNRINNINND